jgi:hypothetical protein
MKYKDMRQVCQTETCDLLISPGQRDLEHPCWCRVDCVRGKKAVGKVLLGAVGYRPIKPLRNAIGVLNP